MGDEKSRREQRKQKHDQIIWTFMVAIAAGVVGMWVIDFVEARYECVDRPHWLAQPKGEGDPPSPTRSFEPNAYDYLRCLF